MTIARSRLAALILAASITAAVFAGISGAAANDTGPVNKSLPELDGTAAQGQTVSTSAGSWSGATPMTYKYQWERCDTNGNNCSNINRATSSQYTLVADDVGHTVRAVVTAHNSGGTKSATSHASDVVKGANVPTNTSKPSISGAAAIGSTLTASNGSWSGTSPITYTYQWNRCNTTGGSCAAISGAKDAKYTVVANDLDHTLRVQVTATNVAGQASILSDATGVVKDGPPANSVAPTISGTPSQGESLNVSDGTWTGSAPIHFAYAWLRCDGAGNNCAAISGADGNSYKLGSADVGHTIRATVTGTNSVGTTNVTAAAVGPVKASTAPPASTSVIAASSVPDSDRLTISSIKYRPGPFHGRGPITATIKVIDENKHPVSGALVYVVPTPLNFASHPGEVPTGATGTATVQLTLTSKAPRSGGLILFIRARTPQGSLLAGSSTRRLVQVRIFAH